MRLLIVHANNYTPQIQDQLGLQSFNFITENWHKQSHAIISVCITCGTKFFYLVEWAIASHGMYKSALVFFNSILKQKNLYIVNYVQCDIQNQHTTMKNKQMLYLWLPEITHVTIRFWNYLFKTDKRISHHLGHFLLTEWEYYCGE
jgi:hypothetical protein